MKNHSRDWSVVDEALTGMKNIVLTTHINPDGDGIGSELALYYHLTNKGKDVKIINTSKTPKIYRFLDPDGTLLKQYEERDEETVRNADLIFVLDISTIERLGTMSEAVEKSPAKKVCIDHHYTNNRRFDVHVVDEEACATAELIYEYVKRDNGKNIDFKIVEAIYIAILTDTGSFRFSNSSAASHRIAAELIELGIKPRKVYEQVYESDSWEKILLLGKMLDRLRSAGDNRIAWSSLTNDIMKTIGATQEDIEGFVEHLSVIDGVEITMLFLELSSGKIKVSIRSKGNHDINRIAEQFGGGGHRHASGILFSEGAMEEISKKVVDAGVRLLEETQAPS